jgi:hypothetical protein
MRNGARRWIAVGSLALAALALAGAWRLFRGAVAVPGPAVEMFVSVEGDGSGVVRAGDKVRVTVRGEPGANLTLLILESSDLFTLARRTVNWPIPAEGLVQSTFDVDARPGRELFVALVTRGPLPDPQAIAAAANAGGADREGRREALRSTLADRLQSGAYSLEAASELEHAP